MIEISKEEVSKLKEILNRHSYIMTNFEGDSKDILNTFTFKKPLSSIEIQNTAPKKVLQFIRDLEIFSLLGMHIIDLKCKNLGLQEKF